MQNANKAWWTDAKIYRSKDVPWKIKCRRMVERSWTELGDGKQRQGGVCSDSKRKRMRALQDTVKGRQERQEQFGDR